MKYILLTILSFVFLVNYAQDTITVPASFSLKEAQNYAIENNQAVNNARLDILIAKKKIWETTAIGLPHADMSLGHNYNIDLPTTLMPAKIFNPNAPDGEFIEMKFGTTHNTSFNFKATQLVFSGEYLVGLAASKIYKNLSENQLEKSEQEIKETIANTYELILIAEERKAIIDSNITSTKSILEDTQAMYESGFAEETDANQLQINLSTLTNGLKSAERQVRILKELLKFQMNIPLTNPIELTEDLETLLSQLNIEGIMGSAFNQENHIDFKIISTQEQIQKLSVKREKSTFLPTVSAFYNHQESMMGNDFEVFSGGSWYDANIVGLSINIPLFSSGQRLTKVSQAKIELNKLENSKQQLSESLYFQVTRARAEFEDAYDKYNLEQDNKKLTATIFNNYQIKYKNGMATSLDLTQAQLQYLNTEEAYFQAIFNLLDAKNKLDKALGLQ